jgi:hypothetical protein
MKMALRALVVSCTALVAVFVLGGAAEASVPYSIPHNTTWYASNGNYIQRDIHDSINSVTSGRLIFQTDGNLVFYRADGPGGGPWRACWGSNTVGSGYKMVYQNDGNLVVYSSSGGAVWASGPPFNGTTVSIEIGGVPYFRTVYFYVGNKLIASC